METVSINSSVEHAPSPQSPALFDHVLDKFNEAQIDLIKVDLDDQDAFDRASDIEFTYARALIDLPAEDIRAVLAKLELIERNHDSQISEDDIRIVISDLMRLAGVERSLTFLPYVWHHQFDSLGGEIHVVDGEVIFLTPSSAPAAARFLGQLTDYQRSAIVAYFKEPVGA